MLRRAAPIEALLTLRADRAAAALARARADLDRVESARSTLDATGADAPSSGGDLARSVAAALHAADLGDRLAAALTARRAAVRAHARAAGRARAAARLAARLGTEAAD
jgi:hypothetical protein